MTMPSVPASTWLSALALPSEAMPRKISLPRPGPEAYAAMAAMPISICVETRMPVRIGGQASGSSTRSSRAIRDIPMPLAASTSDGSTPRSPTMALRTIGSSPYSVRAITVGGDAEAHDRDQQTDQGERGDGQDASTVEVVARLPRPARCDR